MAGRTSEDTDGLVEQAISQQNIEALLDLFELDAVFVEPVSAPFCGAMTGSQSGRGDARVQASDQRNGSADGVDSWRLALVLSKWSMEGSGPDSQLFRQAGTATDMVRRQDDGTWRCVIDNPAGSEHARPGRDDVPSFPS